MYPQPWQTVANFLKLFTGGKRQYRRILGYNVRVYPIPRPLSAQLKREGDARLTALAVARPRNQRCRAIVRAPFQHHCQIALDGEPHRSAFLSGGGNDAADEPAKQGDRLVRSLVPFRERGADVLDLLAIPIRGSGVQSQHRIGDGIRELSQELIALSLERIKTLSKRPRRASLHDFPDDMCDFPIEHIRVALRVPDGLGSLLVELSAL